MNRCPITYESCGNQKYSKKGLQLLSKKIHTLQDFPFTAKEQIELALQLASKLSIQGVQPKLSAKLNVKEGVFEIVERGGTFILKPPHHIYEELPQNEDVTMKFASVANIEVPLQGMIYNGDGSLTYFIKRFDRLPRGHKAAVEDFSQLLGYSRETKYASSMEKLISVIEKYCTFPVLEKMKLFRLTIFNFLVGNEDMHLKNFSLIRRENKVELSPAYDLINSSIVLKSGEELALPLHGKKNKLHRNDFIDYFGEEKLGLSQSIMKEILGQFDMAYSTWITILEKSFLSQNMRNLYLKLLQERKKRLL